MIRALPRWVVFGLAVLSVILGPSQQAVVWAETPVSRPAISTPTLFRHTTQPPTHAKKTKPSRTQKATHQARQRTQKATHQARQRTHKAHSRRKHTRKRRNIRHLMMWTVRGRHTTHTLLGSIHIVPKGFFPLDPKIERAFQQAAAIAVEADIHNVNVLSATWQVLQYGTYCGINPFCSASLRDDLSPALLQRLQRELPRFGLQLDAVTRFKPWFLAIMIQGQMLQRSGISQDGIDQHFLKKANARKIPILQLESLKGQLSIFDQLPPRLQTQMLVSSLEEKEFNQGIQTILRLWKEGNAEKLANKLAEDSKKDPDARLTYTILLDHRNVRMTQKIIRFLREQTRPHFIIVGAAHFVGKNSILDLLQRAGFKPKQASASF